MIWQEEADGIEIVAAFLAYVVHYKVFPEEPFASRFEKAAILARTAPRLLNDSIRVEDALEKHKGWNSGTWNLWGGQYGEAGRGDLQAGVWPVASGISADRDEAHKLDGGWGSEPGKRLSTHPFRKLTLESTFQPRRSRFWYVNWLEVPLPRLIVPQSSPISRRWSDRFRSTKWSCSNIFLTPDDASPKSCPTVPPPTHQPTSPSCVESLPPLRHGPRQKDGEGSIRQTTMTDCLMRMTDHSISKPRPLKIRCDSTYGSSSQPWEMTPLAAP